MKQTTAHSKTPSPTGETPHSADKPQVTGNPTSEFFAAAFSMSWQLAIVVLVPVIGGFELDKKLDTVPALTIIGFIAAMIGMAAVVWHQLQILGPTQVSRGDN